MSDLFKVLVGGGIKPKPPMPETSQLVACPANYMGNGQTQEREATWNVETQHWDLTEWETEVFDCVPAAFSFVGPDLEVCSGWHYSTIPFNETGAAVYDHTLYAMGFTARIRAMYGKPPNSRRGAIAYEVWAPELAGRLCRPHWKEEGPSWKGPESNWQPFMPLDANGYLYVPWRREPEYGSGPAHNPKCGEVIGCRIDIK